MGSRPLVKLTLTRDSICDDMQKQHPCLVPYEELPASEREYDRNTALETLKFIVKAGFRIEKE